MTTPHPGAELRRLMAAGEVVIAPGVYDGLSARLAVRHGFAAAYVSGAGTAASLGLPDMSITGLTELLATVRVVSRTGPRLLVADADTGFGGLPAIRHVAAELSAAGAAAIHIEDQPFPRRCGYLTAEPAIEVSEMLRRLEAARAGAGEMVVVARTDALLVEGIAAAIERAQAYRTAGAEVLMVNGIATLEELELVAANVGRPILYNVSGSDRSPAIDRETARRLGVALVIHPIQAARAAAAAAARYLAALAAGAPVEVGTLMPFREFMDLAGWEDAESFERELRNTL